MKIITILGSPKKHGSIAIVLKRFEELISPLHQVERINLRDYTIHGCLSCNVCQGNLDEPGCVQKDDATAILDRLLAADVIIYATPLYVFDFSSQMKALLDRQYCLTKWQDGQIVKQLYTDKHVALLVTCGGSAEEDADLIQILFDRAMAIGGCHVIGKYIVPHCTTPDQLGSKAESTAINMFDNIMALPTEKNTELAEVGSRS
jgi:multimeric flavodoxin WrbA